MRILNKMKNKITKTKTLAIRRLIRQLAGAHTNCKIIEDNSSDIPILLGDSPQFIVKGGGFRFNNQTGRREICGRIAYIKSSRRVEVGNQFISQLEKLDFKKTTQYYIHYDNLNNNSLNIKVPNLDIANFISNNIPNNNFKISKI